VRRAGLLDLDEVLLQRIFLDLDLVDLLILRETAPSLRRAVDAGEPQWERSVTASELEGSQASARCYSSPSWRKRFEARSAASGTSCAASSRHAGVRVIVAPHCVQVLRRQGS